ncbi:hypothetical protein ACWCPK_41090 [Streptomyces sp. NPDC001953]
MHPHRETGRRPGAGRLGGVRVGRRRSGPRRSAGTARAGPRGVPTAHPPERPGGLRGPSGDPTGERGPAARRGPRAELLAWLGFTDRRPLDAGTLVVLADALPPGLFAVWTVPRPVPTAELTVHFTDALDAAPVEDRVLVRIRTEYAGGGWAVEDSALWSTTGRLLALARQARVLRNGSRAAHGDG